MRILVPLNRQKLDKWKTKAKYATRFRVSLGMDDNG